MNSDGSNPDPEVPQDVNTFISLWRDDPEVDIKLVLKQCTLALQVCVISVLYLVDESETNLISVLESS